MDTGLLVAGIICTMIGIIFAPRWWSVDLGLRAIGHVLLYMGPIMIFISIAPNEAVSTPSLLTLIMIVMASVAVGFLLRYNELSQFTNKV